MTGEPWSVVTNCNPRLQADPKGNNFRPDSTESNKEHGQGLGGSSLVRSTVIIHKWLLKLKIH